MSIDELNDGNVAGVTASQVSSWLADLSVATIDGRPAPHKPLLVLMTLRDVANGAPRLAPISAKATELKDLLEQALPAVSGPSPWQPIWRLESSLWELADDEGDPRRRFAPNGDPPMSALQRPESRGGLTAPVHALLAGDGALVAQLQAEVTGRYLEGLPDDVIAQAAGRLPNREALTWWVNQGRTYANERAGGYVWAPTTQKDGRALAHHTALSQLRPGDVLVHYAGGSIRALGRVAAPAEITTRPGESPDDPDQSPGYRVSVAYFDLANPIPLEDLIGRPAGQGPFNSGGSINQGYMYPLPADWVPHLRAQFASRWPAGSPWEPHRHWLFQANPQQWDLAERLATWPIGEVDTWTLSQHKRHVRDGDDVALFASGAEGGVLAVGTVVGEASARARPDWRGDGPEEELRIGVRLVAKADPPLGRARLKAHAVLSGMAVFKFANATNFAMTDEEWAAMVEMMSEPLTSSQCVVVYVGQSSEGNFEFSLPDGRWGWKSEQANYADVRPGDTLLLGVGFSGGSPRVQPADFAQHGFRRVVVGRVTSKVVNDPTPYWPDELGGGVSYPHRLTFEQVENLREVSIADLDRRFAGPVGEAFRLSALGSGKGVLVPTPAVSAPVVDVPLPRREEPEVVEVLEQVGLAEVVDRFASDLQAAGLDYGGDAHVDFVRAFVTSLCTKRFVILTGLSGSGKTQIAQQFGNWLGAANLQIIAVRPDWTNPDPLLGYEDGLSQLRPGVGRAWHVPDALGFILRAARRPTEPHLLLLDEMNLAHVERYFADVLSGMESDHPVIPNLAVTDGEWRLADASTPRLPIPQNLFIVGTVNVDETTYMFSPKVLDRANTIEFRVQTSHLRPAGRALGRTAAAPRSFTASFLGAATSDVDTTSIGDQLADWFRELHQDLSMQGREFGHRTYSEAIRFANLLFEAGEHDPLVAMDLQVLQKILPKYHGSIRELADALNVLGERCFRGPGASLTGTFDAVTESGAGARLPKSYEKVHRMAKRLRANHFVSFAE